MSILNRFVASLMIVCFALVLGMSATHQHEGAPESGIAITAAGADSAVHHECQLCHGITLHASDVNRRVHQTVLVVVDHSIDLANTMCSSVWAESPSGRGPPAKENSVVPA